MSDLATADGRPDGVADDTSGSHTAFRTDVRVPVANAWQNTWYPKLHAILVLVDALAIALALLATYLATFGAAGGVKVAGATYLTHDLVGLLFGLVWLLFLAAKDSRSARILGTGLEEYRRVLSASAYAFGLLAIVSYLLQAEVSRFFFATTLPVGAMLLLTGRWAVRQALNHARKVGRAMTPALLVGDAREVPHILRDVARNPAAGYSPQAVCLTGADADAGRRTFEGLPVIHPEQLLDHIDRQRLGAILVAGGLSREAIRSLAWQIENSSTQLLLVPQLTDVSGPRLSIRPAEGLNLLHVGLPRYSGAKYWIKRSFDVLFAAAALVVLAPVLLMLAASIKVCDGGPVLFRQERIGLRGEPFTVHKFRTMCVDAEARMDALIQQSGGHALLFKLEDDPRLTRIGAFLRRYSLDELPQFWTVLRGDMSIVGPRPQVAREVAEYTAAAHRRLLIKPGITGLWQVNGRSNLTIEESIRLDLRYVENWSLSSDISIILKTVKVVLFPHGAY